MFKKGKQLSLVPSLLYAAVISAAWTAISFFAFFFSILAALGNPTKGISFILSILSFPITNPVTNFFLDLSPDFNVQLFLLGTTVSYLIIATVLFLLIRRIF